MNVEELAGVVNGGISCRLKYEGGASVGKGVEFCVCPGDSSDENLVYNPISANVNNASSVSAFLNGETICNLNSDDGLNIHRLVSGSDSLTISVYGKSNTGLVRQFDHS